MIDRDDIQLIEDYLSGDENAFGLIISRYLKLVYNFVHRFSGNSDDTPDIVQEVFIKVWKNLKKFDLDKNFKTWLFAIARNTAIDWLRKKKNILFSELDLHIEENEKSFEESVADTEPLPDEIFQRKELKKELENALQKIKPDFREIILLHYTENLTFEEISEMVGRPLNTTKSHHHRALHSLRKILLN